MSVSELERTQLVARLTDVIGEEAAETLMTCILPEGRDQLATKSDFEVLLGKVEALGREVRAEIGELRVQQEALGREVRAEIGELRVQQEALGREIRAEMGELRVQQEALGREIRAEMGELRVQQEALGRGIRAEIVESRSFMELKLARQARLHYGTLTAFMMSMWGVFLAQNFMV